MFNVARDSRNPILSPDPDAPWCAEAVFNPSPAVYAGDRFILYRAAGPAAYYHGHFNVELSNIGVAIERNGVYANLRQLITPEEPWEEFGCEDPRVTKIGDTYYIFYTALGGYPFSADNIKVAVATTRDLMAIDHKHLVTPFNAKAMALFPDDGSGKLRAILTVDSDRPPSKIAIAEFDKIEDVWSPEFWAKWRAELDRHMLILKRASGDHVEVGAPPIRVKDGWLLVYSHIQNYFSDNRVFGIEAALLGYDDPSKIIKKTVFPFMMPEEGYERYGRLPNIVFPSGAILEDPDPDTLTIYYGANDTTCCRVRVSLSALLGSMSSDDVPRQHVVRAPENPILKPIAEHRWESEHVFNPTAIEINDDIYLLYRAVGPENTSVIGCARTRDGVHIDERLPDPIYVPRADFEMKHGGPTDNSGCEDARIVRIGDRLHITYTAYDSVHAPCVTESSITVADFLAHRFDRWSDPVTISPEGVDDKDACIFPEKIGGRYMVLHRIEHHVCADFVDSLDFHRNKITRCIQVFGPRPGMWDSQKIGIAGPPIITPAGWILFYHGIGDDNHYSLGAILFDLFNPTRILGRTSQPIMTPIEPWETAGWIANVVFPCGQVVRGDKVFLYYGGADHVIGVATLSLSELIANLGGKATSLQEGA